MAAFISSYRDTFVILWLLAFLCSLFFINDWQLELFGASFLLLLGWVGFVLTRELNRRSFILIPAGPFAACLAAFWGLTFGSVFWSAAPALSVLAFCLLSALPLGFFGFAALEDGTKKTQAFQTIAYMLAVLFAGLAFWALVQYYALNEIFKGQARHPLSNPGSLGALFNLALFPALGWMVSAQDRKTTILALGLAVLLAGGIFSTGSRGAVLAMAAALLIFVVFARFFVVRHWRRCGVFMALAALLFALTQFGARDKSAIITRLSPVTLFSSHVMEGGAGEKEQARSSQTQLSQAQLSQTQPNQTQPNQTQPGDDRPRQGVSRTSNEALNNRDNIWRSSLAIIRDHWLTGTGAGTFSLYYPAYRLPNDKAGATMAHSDPLQFWAELGVLGPLFFYAMLGTALVRTVGALRARRADVLSRLVILAPFCALLAVVLHAHVTFNFYNLSILLGSGFLLAVWYSATAAGSAEASPASPDDRVLKLAFPQSMGVFLRTTLVLLPLAGLGGVFGALVLGEHFVNQGHAQAMKGDIKTFARNINLADKVSFGTSYRAYLQAATISLGVLEAGAPPVQSRSPLFAGSAPLLRQDRQDLYSQISSYLDNARRLNPRTAAVDYYRARLHRLAGADVLPPDSLAPEALFLAALDLDPLHLGARLELMDLYREGGDSGRAVAIMEAGLGYIYVSAAAPDFYRAAARIYLEKGDREGHARVMNLLAGYNSRANFSQRRRAALMPGFMSDF